MAIKDRQEPRLLQQRIISGRGLILLSPSDLENARILWLSTQLLRRNARFDESFKYNPSRSEYAKVTWCQNDEVIREHAVNYPQQSFEYCADPVGYLSLAVKCQYSNLVVRLQAIADALGVPAGVAEAPIFLDPLEIQIDTIRIVCLGSTALRCLLYVLDYDEGCPEADPPRKKKPRTPPPPAEVPSGAPLGISPPYDGVDDDGDSVPDPLDAGNAPDPVRYVLEYDYVDLADANNSGTFTTDPFFSTTFPLVGNVIFSNFAGTPNNSPLSSDIPVTIDTSVVVSIILVRNRVNGHTITGIRVLPSA